MAIGFCTFVIVPVKCYITLYCHFQAANFSTSVFVLIDEAGLPT